MGFLEAASSITSIPFSFPFSLSIAVSSAVAGLERVCSGERRYRVLAWVVLCFGAA